MADFASFRTMITPVIIQGLFWIGVAACLIGGLVAIAGDEPGGGILLILLGPIVVRIYCELLILFFRMNQTMTEIRRELLRGQQPTQYSTQSWAAQPPQNYGQQPPQPWNS